MKLLLALVLLLCAPLLSEAATLTATTCSYADVNTKVAAAVTGDTVQIPAGSCTWTTQLTITKSITLQGVAPGTEAQCTTGGQTSYTCITTAISMLLWQTVNDGITSLMKDMTVILNGAGSGCSTYNVAGINISGVSTTVRMNNMTIAYGHGDGVGAGGCGAVRWSRAIGVMDHINFIAHDGLLHAVVAVFTGSGSNFLHGDESWFRAHTMGLAGNVFIEDSTFTATAGVIAAGGAYFTDHFQGGRSVTRFSTITGGSLQEHGTESGARDRSFRHIEFYRNNFVWTGASTPAVMAVRGATGKLFDNTATGTMARLVDINTDRAGPSLAQPGYYPWAYCKKQTPISITHVGTTATVTLPTVHGITNGKAYMNISGADQAEYNVTAAIATLTSSTVFTYTTNGTPASDATGTISVGATYDGNTDAAGYPCIDQAGRGKDASLLSGEGPGVGDTMSPKAWLNQALDPIYCFHNMLAGALSACSVTAFGADVTLTLRDYYNEHAAFNGTTNHGVGRGTGRGGEAARPASCTTGDGWWATDDATNWNISTTETYSANISGLSSGADGALDLCTATNTWTNAYYVPYVYPHPLNFGTAPPAPSNPTGLRVVGTTTATSATLIWTPSTNSDFKSFRVYRGTATGVYDLPTITITPASSLAAHKPIAQYTFTWPQAGTYYFVIKEVNTLDLESAASSEVSVVLTGLSRTAAPSRSPRP